MVRGPAGTDTGGIRFQDPTMSFALLDELSLSPAEPSARRLLAERASHRGPGWFDSSWELHRGCEVREGLPADSTLREWLEAWLYPAAGASLSAT